MADDFIGNCLICRHFTANVSCGFANMKTQSSKFLKMLHRISDFGRSNLVVSLTSTGDRSDAECPHSTLACDTDTCSFPEVL